MLIKEAVEEINTPRRMTVQVFAADLDPDAIERARQGLYPETIAADVTPERLARFFVREEAGYRVNKQIRESVVFAPPNLIVDPPFTKVDVISCRNVMIYLSPEVQRKLIPMFHYCLNVSGALFLGTAETVGQFSNLFSPIDGRARVYRRRDVGRSEVSVELPISPEGARRNNVGDGRKAASDEVTATCGRAVLI